MAGAGARLFPENSKLTSAQVNTYLMDQTIMRFATTTARDAAFGGAGEPTLAEGMTCYIDADNSIYTYDGSNWVKMVSASEPNGLWKVQSGTLSVTTSLTNVTEVFDATKYDNYRLILTVTDITVSSRLELRLLSGTTPAQSNAYCNGGLGSDFASNTLLYFQRSNNDTRLLLGFIQTDKRTIAMDIFRPNSAEPTRWSGVYNYDNNGYGYSFHGFHGVASAYDGFALFCTSGTIPVDYVIYGYSK